MFNVQIVKHGNISKEILITICNIKSIFGDYTLESQIKWLEDNLLNDDLHFLIYYKEKLVSYANIIKTELEVEGGKINVYGIGNVCVKEKYKGYGKILMSKVNEFIKHNNRSGILLCRKELVNFYNKNGWKLLTGDNDGINLMIFNLDFNYINAQYKGRLF
ncbi:GNAT family N-acetyltransferase [Photobacterium leiognathi subsp. mandapamensis]|uniref:GNAT family N-acetyltransferase n=1 Tax=Photobacterium leiognathi TaxID=553611 RepID=UPI003AF3CC6C